MPPLGEEEELKIVTGRRLPKKVPVSKARIGRKGSAKTRTGCFTCKFRRVKCDETKPACLRCLSYCGKCDGYLVRGEGKNTPSKRLLPSSSSSSSSSLRPAKFLLPQTVVKLPFRNEAEYQYFDAYRTTLAADLSGSFTSTVWDRIMLQESHHEQFVRSAIIALSALNLSLQTKSDTPEALQSHRIVAMRYYNQAVQMMRQVLTNEIPRLRKILLSCLLVFCFESLQGNQAVATSHARSGYRLLRQSSSESERFIPPSETIESDLLIAFERLALQVLLTADASSPKEHYLEKRRGDKEIAEMPEQFSNVAESDKYWQLIMMRGAHFAYIAGAAIAKEKAAAATGRLVEETDGVLGDEPTSLFEFSSSIHTPYSPKVVPAEILVGKRSHEVELQRWDTAFMPLRLFPGPAVRYGVTWRRLRFLSTKLVLMSTSFTTECSYDEFLPEYRELVIGAREVVQYKKRSDRVFSVDLGILPPLYIVVKFCRDPQIRRQALDILQTSPRREGVWDSCLIGAIGTWSMNTEEEGMKDGFIPEHARIRITNVDSDLSNKTARISWMKRKSALDHSIISQERTITWTDNS